MRQAPEGGPIHPVEQFAQAFHKQSPGVQVDLMAPEVKVIALPQAPHLLILNQAVEPIDKIILPGSERVVSGAEWAEMWDESRDPKSRDVYGKIVRLASSKPVKYGTAAAALGSIAFGIGTAVENTFDHAPITYAQELPVEETSDDATPPPTEVEVAATTIEAETEVDPNAEVDVASAETLRVHPEIPWGNNGRGAEVRFSSQRMQEYFATIDRINHPELSRASDASEEAIHAPNIPGADNTDIYSQSSQDWTPSDPKLFYGPISLFINTDSTGAIIYNLVARPAAMKLEYNNPDSSFPYIWKYFEDIRLEKFKDRADNGQRGVALSVAKNTPTRELVVIDAEALNQAAELYVELKPKFSELGIEDSSFWEEVSSNMQKHTSQSERLNYVNNVLKVGLSPALLNN